MTAGDIASYNEYVKGLSDDPKGLGEVKKRLEDLPVRGVLHGAWAVQGSGVARLVGGVKGVVDDIKKPSEIDKGQKAFKPNYNDPKNVANKPRLEKQLASESQVKNPGHPMDFDKLRQADRLSKQYGGRPNDWKKMYSRDYRARDGVQFETHWYENTVTGQKVEFKTKFTK